MNDASAEDATFGLPEAVGRDLYYATRCATPENAGEQMRFALLAALKALDESGGDD